MSLTEKKHNNTIEVVDISDEGNDEGNEDQLLQNSHANDKEATLPSTENIQISNVATIPVIDLSDDDGENFDANEKEQTPPKKLTNEELFSKTQPRKRKYVGLYQHYRNEQDKKKSANIEEAQKTTDNNEYQPTNKKQRRDSGEFCPLAKRNPSTSQSVFQEAALGDNKNDKPLQNFDQNDFQPKAQTGPSNKSPKTRPRTFISRHVRETSNFIEHHHALTKLLNYINENIHLQALLVQKDKVLENCEKERIDMNLTLISKHKELEICKQEIKTVNKQLRKTKKEQKKQKIKHDKQLKQALQKAKRESQLEQQKVIDHMQEINDFQVQMISAYKELGHGAHSDQTTSSDKLVNSYQVLTDLQEMISSYKELGHGEHSDQTTSPDKLVNCYQVLTELQDQTIELLKASCKEHIKKNA